MKDWSWYYIMSKKDTKQKDTKKEKNGVRTKNVFGKNLGRTNIIILLCGALLITALSWWLVTSAVQRDIDKYNKDIKNLNSQIASLKNQKNEELIDTSLFMAALPETINPEEVRNEITNAARSSGLEVKVPYLNISYTADSDVPTSISGLNNEVKSYYYSVSVTANNVDILLDFIENLYSTGGVSSRILYLEQVNITGMDADKVSASLAIYTFYRPQV